MSALWKVSLRPLDSTPLSTARCSQNSFSAATFSVVRAAQLVHITRFELLAARRALSQPGCTSMRKMLPSTCSQRIGSSQMELAQEIRSIIFEATFIGIDLREPFFQFPRRQPSAHGSSGRHAATDLLSTNRSDTGDTYSRNWSMHLRGQHLWHKVSCLRSAISCSLAQHCIAVHTSSASFRVHCT